LKALICGSRKWEDGELVEHIICEYLAKFNSLEIVEGEANGADSLARQAAESLDIVVYKYPYIGKLGAYGGKARNQQMLTDENPDFCVGFSDDIGNSNGTLDMFQRSKKAEKPTIHVYHADDPEMYLYGWYWWANPDDTFALDPVSYEV
jgi:hypothetical protein